MLAGPAAEDDGDAGLAARGGVAAECRPERGCGHVRGGVVHRLDRIHLRWRAWLRRDPRSARHRRRHGRPAATRSPTTRSTRRSRWPSTYVAGGDLEYGRYGNPTWTAFEDALGALEGGRCLTFASGLAAVATVLDLVGTGGQGGGAAARLQRHRSCSSPTSRRAAGSTAELVDITDTDAVVAACDGRRAGVAGVADQPRPRGRRHRDDHRGRARGRRLRRRRQHLRHSPAAAAARARRRHRRALGDEVPRRPQRRADGRDRHPRRRAVRRAQGPPRPGRRHPRALRGLAGPARPAHPAPARRARAGQRPGARTPPRASTPRVERGPLPGLRRRSSRSCSPQGAMAADLLTRTTRLWVHATSLGGVESTFERRRRWKAEPATIPDGLVRLSVGIEDVEDLWADLRRRWTTWSATRRDLSATGRPGVGVSRVSALVSRAMKASIMSAARHPARRPRRRRARRSGRRRRVRARRAAEQDEHDFAPSATWRVEA